MFQLVSCYRNLLEMAEWVVRYDIKATSAWPKIRENVALQA